MDMKRIDKLLSEVVAHHDRGEVPPGEFYITRAGNLIDMHKGVFDKGLSLRDYLADEVFKGSGVDADKHLEELGWIRGNAALYFRFVALSYIEPTEGQYEVLLKVIQHILRYGTLRLYIGNEEPRVYSSSTPKRIIQDIKDYYSTAKPVKPKSNKEWVYAIYQSIAKDDGSLTAPILTKIFKSLDMAVDYYNNTLKDKWVLEEMAGGCESTSKISVHEINDLVEDYDEPAWLVSADFIEDSNRYHISFYREELL